MISKMSTKDPSSSIPSRLYAQLNQVVIQMEPIDLVKYLSLINAIVLDKRTEPTVFNLCFSFLIL